MNNQASLSAMRKLGLWGMAQHFESLIRLPLDQHPTADQVVAQLIESEQAHRQHRKTQRSVREARFRYQAAVEEISYLPTRNLDKNQVLRLADLSFIERGENILITGATGCGKSFLASALGHQACHQGLRPGRRRGCLLLLVQTVPKTASSSGRRLVSERDGPAGKTASADFR